MREIFISRQQTEAGPFRRNSSEESKGVYFRSSHWNAGLWCLSRVIFVSSGKPEELNTDEWPGACHNAEGGMERGRAAVRGSS